MDLTSGSNNQGYLILILTTYCCGEFVCANREKSNLISHFLMNNPQSIYGLFGGTTQSGKKLYELKLEQENIKDASLFLTKYLQSCFNYWFYVL